MKTAIAIAAAMLFLLAACSTSESVKEPHPLLGQKIPETATTIAENTALESGSSASIAPPATIAGLTPYETMRQQQAGITDVVDAAEQNCDSEQITIPGKRYTSWEYDSICIYRQFDTRCATAIRRNIYIGSPTECIDNAIAFFRDDREQDWIGAPSSRPYSEMTEAEQSSARMGHHSAITGVEFFVTEIETENPNCDIYNPAHRQCVTAAITEACIAQHRLRMLLGDQQDCIEEIIHDRMNDYCTGWLALPEEQTEQKWVQQTFAVCEANLAPYEDRWQCSEWQESEQRNCENAAIKESCQNLADQNIWDGTAESCHEHAMFHNEHGWELSYGWMRQGIETARQQIEQQ